MFTSNAGWLLFVVCCPLLAFLFLFLFFVDVLLFGCCCWRRSYTAVAVPRKVATEKGINTASVCGVLMAAFEASSTGSSSDGTSMAATHVRLRMLMLMLTWPLELFVLFFMCAAWILEQR